MVSCIGLGRSDFDRISTEIRSDKKRRMATRTTLPGSFMPTVGLGCWQSAPGEIEKAIEWSLDAGVRLIDTAYMYTNEKEIGNVLTKYIKAGREITQ